MPSKTHKVLGGLFERDNEAPKVQAKARKLGLTVSNYFRALAGFTPLKNGAPYGSQNAKKRGSK
jgi:hypothetical protein